MFTGSAVCVSFKVELFNAVHDCTNDTFKMALYDEDASLDVNTTVYTTDGEVVGANYTAGGVVLTNTVPTYTGITAYTQWQNATFSSVTLATRGALIYNATKSNKAVCVIDFGLLISKDAEDLVITLPTFDFNNALLRIA